MPQKIKQNKDSELDLAIKYDYKRVMDRLVLRMYLHTIGLIGMVLAIVGLVAYVPIPKWASVGLTLLGAVIMILSWHFMDKLKEGLSDLQIG